MVEHFLWLNSSFDVKSPSDSFCNKSTSVRTQAISCHVTVNFLTWLTSVFCFVACLVPAACRISVSSNFEQKQHFSSPKLYSSLFLVEHWATSPLFYPWLVYFFSPSFICLFVTIQGTWIMVTGIAHKKGSRNIVIFVISQQEHWFQQVLGDSGRHFLTPVLCWAQCSQFFPLFLFFFVASDKCSTSYIHNHLFLKSCKGTSDIRN